ncbi:MAG: hypothetical protein U0271_03315 [Polyangiaceae bacterium]
MFVRHLMAVATLGLGVAMLFSFGGCSAGDPNCDDCEEGEYCAVGYTCGQDGLTPCSITSGCVAIPEECAADPSCDCLLPSTRANVLSTQEFGNHSFVCYSGGPQTFPTVAAGVDFYCPPGNSC